MLPTTKRNERAQGGIEPPQSKPASQVEVLFVVQQVLARTNLRENIYTTALYSRALLTTVLLGEPHMFAGANLHLRVSLEIARLLVDRRSATRTPTPAVLALPRPPSCRVMRSFFLGC